MLNALAFDPLGTLEPLALNPLRPFYPLKALWTLRALDVLALDPLWTLSAFHARAFDALALNALRALGPLDLLTLHPLRPLGRLSAFGRLRALRLALTASLTGLGSVIAVLAATLAGCRRSQCQRRNTSNQ